MDLVVGSMTFSVIVPVYNVEKYIAQCVESVLTQNYEDFELILVDDGSTDASGKICDHFAASDSRIQVIHKKNGGASDARNAGIKAATGDYLLFLDSDDFWQTERVLDHIFHMLDRTGVTVVQFGHEVFLHNENTIVKGLPRNYSIYNGKSIDEMLWELVHKGGLAISACSMAISRNFILENELFFKKNLKTEDLEWAIRLFISEPIFICSDEYLYAYRKQHAGRITSQIDYAHLCQYCWILESSVARVEHCKDRLKIALMSYLMYHVLIASALCYRVRLERHQRKELLSRLETVSKDRMAQYTLNPKVKLASVIYKIFGFTAMSKVLGFYLNHRGR